MVVFLKLHHQRFVYNIHDEQMFMNYCVMQDLYEIAYAFSADFNMDAFNLYVMIPRQFVPCTNTCIGDLNFGQSSVFVIEEGSDVVPFLSSKQDEVTQYPHACTQERRGTERKRGSGREECTLTLHLCISLS